jgi:hypothetical protein
MTIDEAINELTKQLGEKYSTPHTPFHNAMKFGLEALKRCRTLAENSPLWAAKPLPGETKEDR